MYELRPYQTALKNEVYALWNAGVPNLLPVMPTGAGKTVFVSEIFREHKGAAVAIAHRQELVSQISLALARQGVYHNLIASRQTVKFISTYHVMELGHSFFHPQAPVTVAGVDTLLRRDLGQWAHQVTLCFQDEAHHVLRSNKWGKAADQFPNARHLGTTATPSRADGHGLGRHAQGIFDAMLEGPTMRELINMGNLTDYRVFAAPSDINFEDIDISSATGDLNQNQLREATHQSATIVGDIVDHYFDVARNKTGVTFAVDVEAATEIASRFKHYGLSAEVVSAKTPDRVRVELINAFKRREIMQLVNVDLFGEGFDLPAIEVVSMGRRTESLSLYMQQFGRALRPMEGKEKAIILDHVGNTIRHGLPDAPRQWTLDSRERRSRLKGDDDVAPVTACTNCMSVYERFLVACPYCGSRPEPAERSKPKQVDGNLYELSPEALAELRGEVAAARETPQALKNRMTFAGAPSVAINSAAKHREEHHVVLDQLTETINWWGAHIEATGVGREEAYKRFYHRFGTDVLSAQTLPKADAVALTERIKGDLHA